jgi:hypothetical protein
LKDIIKRIRSPSERKHSRISIRLQDKLNNQKDSKMADSQKIQIQMSYTPNHDLVQKSDMKPYLPVIAKKKTLHDEILKAEVISPLQ